MVEDNNGNLVESPIHESFGLTYASFLVVPRLLMEAMPWGWQKDMVHLMDEFTEKYEWDDEGIEISKRGDDGLFVKIDENLCNYKRGDATIYKTDKQPTKFKL